VVTMFSEYCSTPFHIEKITNLPQHIQFPQFEMREVEVEVDYLNKGIGIQIEPDSLVGLLHKMSIPSKLSKDKNY